MWRLKSCPKCGGSLFFDRDMDGWYEQCINCSYRNDLKVSVDAAQKVVKEGSGLILNLIYNPAGAFLPVDEAALEWDFKRELFSQHGIVFNSLYALTNMPINRFRIELEKLGTYHDYMIKLKSAFNPEAARNVMCRNQISIGYDGSIYDCDFNQMLGLQVSIETPVTVFDFDYDRLLERRIVFGSHCYGCTAGAGSSCGGATT